MNSILRLLLLVLLVLGGVRTFEFARYVRAQSASALEAHHLESKMVHLAWRVQHGERLYPEWRDGPYVCNFFTPLYFVTVGRIGRSVGASLDDLYAIGRAVTIAAELAAAAMLVLAVHARYGRVPALVAASVAVGSAAETGFAVMTRPDVLADTLGLAGFLLAIGATPPRRVAGTTLLALAVLTKQTAVLYLIATGLAWLARGRPRMALAIAGGGAAATAAAIVALTLIVEPRMARDILGEAFLPWTLPGWLALWERVIRLAPELPVLVAAGAWLWAAGPCRDPALLALAATQAIGVLILPAKTGADLNYWLAWRAVATLAAGALAAAALQPGDRPRRLAIGLLVVVTSVAVTIHPGHYRSLFARSMGEFLASPEGREVIVTHRAIARVAADPGARFLTDDGYFDIRQGARALFADPWLFRSLVEVGRVNPKALRQSIERRDFARVVTRKNLFDPDYPEYGFGLPRNLVPSLRRHYELESQVYGLFLYVPRREVAEPAGTTPPVREGGDRLRR